MYKKIIWFVMLVFACIMIGIKGQDCPNGEDGNGICLPECPEGSKIYSPGCSGRGRSQRTQRTCSQPVAYRVQARCDVTYCDCTQPRVLDEATNKCVERSECSTQKNKAPNSS